MANYMSQVAKMLGVELGERFDINGFNEFYFLDTDGLYSFNGTYCKCDEYFSKLLAGELTIKRKPWKPKRGETYWYVEKDGDVLEMEWHPCRYMSNHVNRYKLGNCYRTCEEAEANRDKWVKFYASNEVLEV